MNSNTQLPTFSLVISILFLILINLTSHEAIAAAESQNPLHNFDLSSFPNVQNNFKSFLNNFHLESSNHLALKASGINPECLAHIEAWARPDNLLSTEWSLRMIDSMSKIPEGILSGHMNSYGDFDECLGIRAEANNKTGLITNFKGQYCSTHFAPKMFCENPVNHQIKGLNVNVPLIKPQVSQEEISPSGAIENLLAGFAINVATCMPSSCSTQDVQSILSAAMQNSSTICLVVDHCQTDDRPKLTSGDIAMIVILVIIGILCLVGTTLDLLLFKTNKSPNNNKNKAIQSILAFSIYTNTTKWLNTKSGADNLGCIHGIRFLSTCWVVLAHTWSSWISKVWNIFDVLTIYKDWTIYPIFNGTVSVDTFFTLSGLLVAYGLMKMLDKTKGKLNIPMFYLHRYLRLTPTYGLLIGIMATWYQYLRPGPHTYQFEYFAAGCRKNWWHNILYINNLIKYDINKPEEQECHGESWYLANDMQFFIISPLIIYLVWKWRKIGLTFMGILTIASIAIPFGITYDQKLDATMLPMSPNLMQYMTEFYSKPWLRFGPYIVGLWAGFLLYKIKSRRTPIKLSSWLVLIGWCTSTATALAIIFGPISYFDPENDYNRVGSAFYGGFHRFCWGIVISWIVLACTLGYGGFINKFLSWKVFIPLGRLSFCTYLISLWLQTLYYASARQSMSYDLYTGINHFFSHMVLSLLVSFIACMTLESPFIALEKIIFGGDEGNPKPIQKEPFENSSSGSSNSSCENGDNSHLKA